MDEVGKTYKRVDGLDCNEVPDGYVIYHEQRQQVHFLNVTAAAVLELCDGNADVNRITAVVQEAFQLSSPPVAEVEACIASLLSLGLVERCSPSSSAA